MISFKTEPFEHQREELERHWSDYVRAIFWEMGIGKSKVVIDTAACLHAAGKVDALLVIAPNGVQRNWIDEELPKHASFDYAAACWESRRANTKAQQRKFDALRDGDMFAVLAMSYDAMATPRGYATIVDFLTKRTALFVLDESTRIKTPGAARTKRALQLAKYAPYRRILTGTPVTNGPFDAYSQVRFLEPNFWRQHGIGTYAAFKAYFAIMERRENHQQRRMYDHVVAYRRLNRLQEMLREISGRVTKDQVLDLPPKLFTERAYEPTKEQRRLYQQLRDEYIVWLESGEPVTADMAITRLLRLQQILCGYLPSDLHEGPEPAGSGPWGHEACDLKEGNPRLEALMDVLEELPRERKAIIWARFRRDVDIIVDALNEAGERVVRYDGKVDDDGRTAAKRAFQEGDARFFVGNPKAAGLGLTLTAATTVVYYSNSFDLEERLQSEDRAHRIGQDGVPVEGEDGNRVIYVDLVAPGTVDRYIVQSLRKKFNIAAQITGDDLRKWLD